MKEQSTRKNIRLGIVLSYASMVVSLMGSLFISNRVLNYIGDYNYGLYSFVGSITSWLTVVSSALNASYLRYATIDEKSSEDGAPSKTNTIYLKLLIILSLFALIVGGAVVGTLYGCHVCLGKYDWDDSQVMYALFAISLFNIAISMPSSVYTHYLTLKQKFIFTKFLGIATTILTYAANFLIAYFTRSILLLASYSILSTVLSLAFHCYYSHKQGISFAKVSLRENKTLVWSIVWFSSILLFNTIVDQINTAVDKTLLGIYATPEKVTIYQMGQSFSTYMVSMSVAVSGVFAPQMHLLVAEKNEQGLKDLYLKISKVQTLVLCMVVFGFLACGKDFILWWIGPERIDAFYVGFVLMAIDLCPLTLNASIEIQRAENKHKFRALVYFVVALTNVLLSILFLHLFSSEDAIYACLLGTVIARIASHWVAMNIYNKKAIHLPVGRYMLTLLVYMAIGFACAVPVYFLGKLLAERLDSYLARFLIEGGAFALLYLLIIGLMNRKMVKSLLQRIKKKKEA